MYGTVYVDRGDYEDVVTIEGYGPEPSYEDVTLTLRNNMRVGGVTLTIQVLVDGRWSQVTVPASSIKKALSILEGQ